MELAAVPVPARSQHRDLMESIARREVPVALLLTGAVVLVVGVVNFLLSGRFDASDIVLDALGAALLLVISTVLRGARVSGPTVQWTYALAMTVVVGWLLNEFRLQPDTAEMAYVVIVMAVFGPVVLSWAPFATAASVMTVAAVGVLTASGWGDARGWTAAYGVAIMVGALFLRLRMQSLAELAEAKATADRLATTDPLTGVLNRHGLDLTAPVLVASAMRYGQPLVVWFVDVDQLKAANDRQGHAFGDQVIRAVAVALVESTREGDLVARWGGDEFVVVGLGIDPAQGSLAERVRQHLLESEIDPGRWCRTVSIGSASRMPHTTTLDALIAEADQRMYLARHLV